MPKDRAWNKRYRFSAFASTLTLRSTELTPDAANKASKRPCHGLDLLHTARGMAQLEPGVFVIALGDGVSTRAPLTNAGQWGIATPSSTPPTIVNALGFPAAKATLIDALFKMYPHSDAGQILAAADAAVAVMENPLDVLQIWGVQ